MLTAAGYMVLVPERAGMAHPTRRCSVMMSVPIQRKIRSAHAGGDGRRRGNMDYLKTVPAADSSRIAMMGGRWAGSSVLSRPASRQPSAQ